MITEEEDKTSVQVYPTTEDLLKVTKSLAPEVKFERIFAYPNRNYPKGVEASFRMNVGMWRKLIALEEARGDGVFLNPEEAG